MKYPNSIRCDGESYEGDCRMQLFVNSDDSGSDGMVIEPIDIHLGLSRLEKILILIENTNPYEHSNNWFFDRFARIAEVDAIDSLALLSEIVAVLQEGNEIYRYSEYIDCARIAISQLQLTVDSRSMVLIASGEFVDDPDSIWRSLIECLWFKLTSMEFVNLRRRRDRKVLDNKESMVAYTNALLIKYKRLLVIRLDLSYKAQYASSISEHEARSDLSRLFLNRRRNKDLIPDLVGYICRIEWSERTRYHFHVMLFIDGDKRMKDAHISYKTGLYWENVITRGRGRFYSCNYSGHDYDRPGVGMIHYGNEVEVSNLMDCALSYLVKKSQYLLANSVGHRKNIWTGKLSC